MPLQLLHIQGLKGVRDLIKAVCEKHEALTMFKSGLNLLDDSTQTDYPLAFLESDFSSNVEGQAETYSINLNIADRIPTGASEEEVLSGLSKTEQIASEIYSDLEFIASNIKVLGASKLSFRDYDQDALVVTRIEFQLQITRYSNRLI